MMCALVRVCPGHGRLGVATPPLRVQTTGKAFVGPRGWRRQGGAKGRLYRSLPASFRGEEARRHCDRRRSDRRGVLLSVVQPFPARNVDKEVFFERIGLGVGQFPQGVPGLPGISSDYLRGFPIMPRSEARLVGTFLKVRALDPTGPSSRYRALADPSPVGFLFDL
jgi:hypothetical protein